MLNLKNNKLIKSLDTLIFFVEPKEIYIPATRESLCSIYYSSEFISYEMNEIKI